MKGHGRMAQKVRVGLSWILIALAAEGCKSSRSGGDDPSAQPPHVDPKPPFYTGGAVESPDQTFGEMQSGLSSFVPQAATYELPILLSDIENLDRDVLGKVVTSLSNPAQSRITQNGFVALPFEAEQHYLREQFQEAYLYLSAYDVPVFVSADSVLHLYHLFFDQLLKYVEVQQFVKDLEALTDGMVNASRAQMAGAQGANSDLLKEAARRNVAFFSVAARLLDADYILDATVSDLVEAELALIGKHNQLSKSPLMNLDCPDECNPCDTATGAGLLCMQQGHACLCEDYTQYVPRGHYTTSPDLERYFRAMMWLGRIGFRIKHDMETLQAVLATDALKFAVATYPDGASSGAAEIWERIYRVTGFFVGASDDLTFAEYDQAILALFGEGFEIDTLATDEQAMNQLKEKLAELREPRILGGFAFQLLDETQETMGWRFMGQRFAPDSYVLGQMVMDHIYPDLETPEYHTLVEQVTGLTDPVCDDLTEEMVNNICYIGSSTGVYGVCRLMPRGLDVMAALGSNEAVTLLADDSRYCGFDEQLFAMKEEFGSYDTEAMTQNLYWSWLYVLQPMLETFSLGYPIWMQTGAYRDKALNTALGSWAQLRHDTILYVKQSYTPATAGYVPPAEAFGYVEPVPVLYDRLAGLTRMTRDGLQSLNVMPGQLQTPLDQLATLLDRLASTSVKELTNEALTEEEIEAIKNTGDTFERFIVQLASVVTVEVPNEFSLECNEHPDWCEQHNDPSDPDFAKSSIVADVHTDVNTRQVLEVGTGHLDWIIVVHKIPGSGNLGAAVGPIFSFHEFPHPMNDRLTDEAWRELLSSEAQPRPDWAEAFRAP